MAGLTVFIILTAEDHASYMLCPHLAFWYEYEGTASSLGTTSQ